MKRTLYLTDLDGTLLDNDGRLSPASAAILNRLLDAGVLFTCVTGRPFATAMAALAGLRLSLPVAVCNGAVIAGPADGQVLAACAMDKARLAPLLEGIEARGACPLVFARRGGGVTLAWHRGAETPPVRRYVAAYPEAAHLAPADDYRQLFSGDIHLLSLKGSRREMEALQALLPQDGHTAHHLQQDSYRPQEYWLEVTRRDADKAHALLRLKALAGADETVCFGDNMNDLPMFRAADRCCAVANACDELKAAASCVIPPNHEDGVARWLEENAVPAPPAHPTHKEPTCPSKP